MTVSVTNRTRQQLRVVLPPGLIAKVPPANSAAWVVWAAAWAVVWAAAWAVAWAAAWAAWAAAWAAWAAWAAAMRGMGSMGRIVRHDARHDGHDDARSDHHVFLRGPRQLGHAQPDDRHDGYERVWAAAWAVAWAAVWVAA